VRGLSLRVVTANGEWRAAMIDAPFFPVGTVEAFYELGKAMADRSNPGTMKNFAAMHPEIGAFGKWASKAPWAASYAEERFNSINSFVFTNAEGRDQVVRWSFVPTTQVEELSADQLKERGSDFLDADIAKRVQSAPQRWALMITAALPGDPTADPSKAWPENRTSVNAGTLVVSAIEPEPNGPCRDLNFDPTVLPAGMRVSDDPFPAARSAAYAVSFNRRAAEDKDYPHTPATGARQ
jgi:catalase